MIKFGKGKDLIIKLQCHFELIKSKSFFLKFPGFKVLCEVLRTT